MNKIPIPLNSVCIDTSALSKTAFSLSKKFSLIEFLDFCAIIEQMVLRDALILTGSANAPQKSMLAPIKKWMDSSAIIVALEQPKPVFIRHAGNHEIFQRHADIADSEKTGPGDAAYETGRLLAAQQYFERPAMPLTRNFLTYDQIARPDINQMAFDIVSQYEKQAGHLHDIKHYANRNVPKYVQIDFPPIAIEIIRDATDFGDLVEITLQRRNYYSGLRVRVNELDQIQRDPSISAAKKLAEMRGWMESWNSNLEANKSSKLILGKTIIEGVIGGAKFSKGVAEGKPIDFLEGTTEVYEKLSETIKMVQNYQNNQVLQPIRSAFMSSLDTSQKEITERVDALFNYAPAKFQELLRVSCLARGNVLEELVDHVMRVRISQD